MCLKRYLRFHPGAHYLREGLSRRMVALQAQVGMPWIHSYWAEWLLRALQLLGGVTAQHAYRSSSCRPAPNQAHCLPLGGTASRCPNSRPAPPNPVGTGALQLAGAAA